MAFPAPVYGYGCHGGGQDNEVGEHTTSDFDDGLWTGLHKSYVTIPRKKGWIGAPISR